MGRPDRFNRITAAMVLMAERGMDPVLAVRHQGLVREFRVNGLTHHLESDGGPHPRTVLEDDDTEFVEGYPSRDVDRRLSEIW